MKYALICIGGLVLAIGLSVLIVLLINRKKKLSILFKAIAIPLSSIVLSACFLLTYFAFNYRASDTARSYLESDSVVNFKNAQHWYEFDNIENNENAIIFYSGGKVEDASYAELCSEISHQGIDVFLLKMPLYFPLLNIKGADKVVNVKEYKNVYLMGHSLGGTTAALYLKDTRYSYKGIIFLASYANKKLNDDYKCLSIYGSNDTVLNKKEYEKNKSNFPSGYKEVVIEGGIHSYFGDYGNQRGDGTPTITRDEQITKTKEEVLSFITSE